MIPVAQRVLGASHDHTLRMKWAYTRALCTDPAVTRDDLRGRDDVEQTRTDSARRARRRAPGHNGDRERSARARAALSAHEESTSAGRWPRWRRRRAGLARQADRMVLKTRRMRLALQPPPPPGAASSSPSILREGKLNSVESGRQARRAASEGVR